MEIVIILVVVLAGMALFFKKQSESLPFSPGFPRFSAPIAGQLVLRNDIQGAGHFGAPRGSRKHEGIDFVAPAQKAVLAPISGVIRKLQVYSTDPKWQGVAIKSGDVEVKMFYVSPLAKLPVNINRGEIVGFMQDRAAASPGMINHIHFELRIKGTIQDPGQYFTYIK